MRTRISHQPKLVASSSDDTTIQNLCRFNRKQYYNESKKKTYILMMFGIKKTITEQEYNNCISRGLTDLVRIEYA